jgi:hypothetical protein
MPVEILRMHPAMVAEAWPMAMPLLAAPIEMSRGCFLPEDVQALCAAGNGQLWLAFEGDDVLSAYVTEIYQYPRKRVVRALFAGGKPGTMDRWLEPMVAAIERWARETWQCQGIEAIGRKGWTRVLDGEQVGVYLCRDFPAVAEGVH